MSQITDNSFKCPVIGIDPVTKGTFIIKWAYIDYDFDTMFHKVFMEVTGRISIPGGNTNPLFVLCKDNPLRLQGLLGSVDFGAEKRFIQINRIVKFKLWEMFEDKDNSVDLEMVRFKILDNLDYLEEIKDYRDNNFV